MSKSDRLAHRAGMLGKVGGLDAAVEQGLVPRRVDTTLAEAVVLGLLLQGVRTWLCVLGHGTTELGEVLRVYEEAGLLRTIGLRSEIEASHAAAALRWVTGEKAAVVTSIGPGALQALAASLVSASDGLGVWYVVGDETTEDEGPNMQQVPRHEQGLFLRLFSAMGDAYSLHTPAALPTALRRGATAVDHPARPGPFFLLLPMNMQPAPMKDFNLDELPRVGPLRLGPAPDDGLYDVAVDALLAAERVVVKVGGGARGAGPELDEFLDLCDGVAVTSPLVSGVLPYEHRRNMFVGGSKGSICGNHAMEKADLLVALGSRAVCQSDCSRTSYPRVRTVLNVNADLRSAAHYGRSLALVGDAAATLRGLNEHLRARPAKRAGRWLASCTAKRAKWEEFKQARWERPTLPDPVWGMEVLTQPAAIKAATDWARAHDAVCFFDAGDVQAAADQLDWYADEARRIYGRVVDGHSRDARLLVLRQPVGPVAAFAPWNFPALLPMRKVAAALAAGCSVVLKPAEEAPRTAMMLAQACHDAGQPAGALNVVTGVPEQISAHLVRSPIIRKMSFTGSVPVGKIIAGLCAEGVKPVSLELGGHSPVLVFADADVERAAETCALAKFRNMGQVCISASRFYVQEPVLDRFVDRFKEVTAAMRVMREEPFGPVAPIAGFADLDHALSLANATEYGLAAYVFTENTKTAFLASEGLEVGMVGVNHMAIAAAELPFGGIKASGYGREGGSEGIEAYSVAKMLSVRL